MDEEDRGVQLKRIVLDKADLYGELLARNAPGSLADPSKDFMRAKQDRIQDEIDRIDDELESERLAIFKDRSLSSEEFERRMGAFMDKKIARMQEALEKIKGKAA